MLFLFMLIIVFINILAEYKYSSVNGKNEFNPKRIVLKFHAVLSFEFTRNVNGVMVTANPEIDILNKKFRCISIRKLFKRGNEKKGYFDLNLGNIYIFEFEKIENMESMIQKYFNTGKLEYVEPDYVGKGGGISRLTPGDEYYFRQWSLSNDGTFPPEHPGTFDADIDMDEAWEIEQGSSDIIAAVLDSGCRLVHPELQTRIWNNSLEIPGNGIDDDGNDYIDDYQGWDFAYNDNNPTDYHGHGTNVTGILGATGDNSIGYAGIDWNCQIMICQILNNSGWGYYTWWTEAIYYAVNNGAKTLNMSVGGSSYSSSMEDAVDYAQANDVVINACMMNTNNSTSYYPAAYANTIAVGATDTDDTRCNPFSWGGGSNYGAHIDVVAPGNYIYGLKYNSDTNYDSYWGGTSQATPHVTGLVSLLFAQNGSLTFDEIRNIVRTTSEDQVGYIYEDIPGWDQYYGYGRINAFAALNFMINSPQNVNITINGIFVEISWDSYPDATSYKIYSSEDPYEDVELWFEEATGVIDTFWSEEITDNRKFYCVKAVIE